MNIRNVSTPSVLIVVTWCSFLNVQKPPLRTLRVLLLHLAPVLSQVGPDVVLLPQRLGPPRRLRGAPAVAPRRLLLVALEPHVEQLEAVSVDAHLAHALHLVVDGVEAPEAVAPPGLVTLVVAKLHGKGERVTLQSSLPHRRVVQVPNIECVHGI